MEDSILKTIKKMLGITDDYTVFDQDLIVLINMAFNTLSQIGVGPSTGFAISGYTESWEEFIGIDPMLEMIKSYTYLKVKQVWDSDISGSLKDAINKQIEELTWRISVQVDPGEETE